MDKDIDKLDQIDVDEMEEEEPLPVVFTQEFADMKEEEVQEDKYPQAIEELEED